MGREEDSSVALAEVRPLVSAWVKELVVVLVCPLVAFAQTGQLVDLVGRKLGTTEKVTVALG